MVKLSIIVCTYNREKYIGSTLKHLLNQSESIDSYEVIIVNNNSTDNTERVCQTFLSKNPYLNWMHVNEGNQGHTFARNRGIKESSGDLVAFIDDDAFVDEEYVNNTIQFFNNNPEINAIGGKIIPQYEHSEPKWISKYLLPLVSALDMGNKAKPFKGNKFPIGANMAYRSSVFYKYGNFDVNLGRRGEGLEGGDEKELIYRLKKNGELIYYVPEITVQHIIPEKRLKMGYIKGLAKGVAVSEKKRISKYGAKEVTKKIIEELIKIGGSIVLTIKYYLKFDFAKGNMLIKFRYWVLISYFKDSGSYE